MYIGSELLNGKLLYQEIWDNKQPLLYAIDAFGLWLGGGSAWGVWALELFFLMVIFYICYRLIRKALPPLESFCVISIAFLAVFPFMGGNYSEEYSLLFQIGILAVLYGVYLPNRNRFSRPMAAGMIGVFSGLVFLIKQNYLDVTVTVALSFIFLAWVEHNLRGLRDLGLIFAGFAVVNIPVFIYFWANGALEEYIVAAFLFNRYYTFLGLDERITSVVEKIKFVTSHPLFLLTISMWLGGLFVTINKWRDVLLMMVRLRWVKWLIIAGIAGSVMLFIAARIRGGTPQGYLTLLSIGTVCIFLLIGGISYFVGRYRPSVKVDDTLVRSQFERQDLYRPGYATFLFLGLIDLPVVFLSIAISGKQFTHYYVTMFSALILIMAGFLTYLRERVFLPSQRVLLSYSMLAILLAGGFPPANQIVTYLRDPIRSDARLATAEYLKSVTTPEDKILVWGWEAGIYYLADRQAPTRFAFPFGLYLSSPYQEEYADILLMDLKENPPEYIVDLMEAAMPLIGGRPGEACYADNAMPTGSLQSILAFVCGHYDFDRSIENYNIYKWRGNPDPS